MKKLMALVLSLALVLTCLALPAVAEEERTGGTLIAWLASDPVGYNGNAVMDDYSLQVIDNVFSKLLKFDYAGNLLPDLAESWEFSDDNLTVTFHLHQNVKWHDGEDFSAEDVVWSLEKVKAEGYNASALAYVDTIEAADHDTVVMKLTSPDASLLYNVAYYGCYILPKHLYEGEDWLTCDAAVSNPVGTGAYKFVSHDKGVSITLEANMDYYLGVPQTDTIIYSIIPDATTAVQAFLNGEIDYLGTGVPSTEFDNLRAAGANVLVAPFASRYYIAFNFQKEAMADLAVRQAITLGVDRQAILDKALDGIGSVCEGFAPAAIAWAYNDEDVLPERDVEKAIQILEEAGYTRGDDGYFMTLSLVTMTGYDTMATVIKSNLQEIGVNVDISVYDMGAYVGIVMGTGEFDMTLLSGNHGPDASAMQMRVGTGGTVNVMSYSNPELDELYEKGLSTVDQDERAVYYKAAQKILSEDLPILPLCEAVITEVTAGYLSNTPMSQEGLAGYAELWVVKLNQN